MTPGRVLLWEYESDPRKRGQDGRPVIPDPQALGGRGVPIRSRIAHRRQGGGIWIPDALRVAKATRTLAQRSARIQHPPTDGRRDVEDDVVGVLRIVRRQMAQRAEVI